MQVRGRLSALTTVGVMGLLALGGAAWSVATNPKVADVQVDLAAKNTVAASSFVGNLDLTTALSYGSGGGPGTLPGGAGGAETTHLSFDYHAPNLVMVQETGSDGSGETDYNLKLTQIGSDCWAQVTEGGQGPASQPQLCSSDSISQVLAFVKGLEKPSGATNRGGTYYLSAADSAHFDRTAFQGAYTIDKSGSAHPPAPVEVRLDGSNVSWERASFSATTQQNGVAFGIRVDIVGNFTQFGSAPTIVRPAGQPTAVSSAT
jgi:hypothetical protein